MCNLKKNKAKCLKCCDVIESTYRNDFVTCTCGNLSIDGGTDYIRRGAIGGKDSFQELSEYNSYDNLKSLYNTAKSIDPSEAMRYFNQAKTDEERKFFAFIADMNLQRAQKDVIKKGLF